MLSRIRAARPALSDETCSRVSTGAVAVQMHVRERRPRVEVISQALHDPAPALRRAPDVHYSAAGAVDDVDALLVRRLDPPPRLGKSMFSAQCVASAARWRVGHHGGESNISLDAGTLAAIDEGAAAHGLTRSAFIASALQREDPALYIDKVPKNYGFPKSLKVFDRAGKDCPSSWPARYPTMEISLTSCE